jgi:dephospho-CoA kinase
LKKIGITGGIGSGKTTVTKLFAMLDVPIINADEEAKKLYYENEELKQKIISLLGNESYIEGVFNKPFISSVIFSDEEKRKQLNALVHPLAIAKMNEWMQQYNHTPYILKEAALLIESNSYKVLDAVIHVTSPIDIRIQRVMKREKISRQEVENRIQAQMPEEEKLKYATYIIYNDDEHLLMPQVLYIHQQILATNNL